MVKGQIYHVFNRSINREPIFVKKRECERALTALEYYLPLLTPIRLSHFLEWEKERASKYLMNLKKRGNRVDILARKFNIELYF